MGWARPGVKCVCIKRGNWRGVISRGEGAGPIYGETCTIDFVGVHSTGKVGLRLAGYKGMFNPNKFRPLVTKTQADDIALFTHHLDQVPA